jgi:hypothetical protein
VAEAQGGDQEALAAKDGYIWREELKATWDWLLELFGPREGPVFERWLWRWLESLFHQKRRAFDALLTVRLAERDIDQARLMGVVEEAGGIALTPLPRWETVRLQERETAPPEWRFLFGDEEPPQVTVELVPDVYQFLMTEVERRYKGEHWHGETREDLQGMVITKALRIWNMIRTGPSLLAPGSAMDPASARPAPEEDTEP